MKKQITAALAAATLLTLASCGPKHDAEKAVKLQQKFTEAANEAVKDGTLSESEIDELYGIQMKLIKLNKKYKEADSAKVKEYEKAMEKTIDPKTASEYAGSMFMIAITENADELAEKLNEAKDED